MKTAMCREDFINMPEGTKLTQATGGKFTFVKYTQSPDFCVVARNEKGREGTYLPMGFIYAEPAKTPNPTIFEWGNLHGKKLDIFVGVDKASPYSKDHSCEIIMGKDEDGTLYVLNFRELT